MSFVTPECHPEPFGFAQDRLREGSAPVDPLFFVILSEAKDLLWLITRADPSSLGSSG
jgi:hypothetical protein